jgi:hypothetical protein
MMLGDLNFQLKLVWVESELWLTKFVHLEFHRVFRDRIDPLNNPLLEMFDEIAGKDMVSDEQE